MEKTFNDILLEILTIINYQNDKKHFVQEFQAQSYAETIANLIEKLSAETQTHIKNASDQAEEIKKNIDAEKFQEEFEKVSSQAMIDFLQAIDKTLTPEQQTKIEELLKTP